MATEHDEPRIIRVGEAPRRTWAVYLGDDATPISKHQTRGEAETAARTHAETFGYPEVVIYGLDGDEARIRIDDPDPQPPYPGPVTGESAG